MASGRGANIPLDSLSLCIDAGNPRSYSPFGGDELYDVSKSKVTLASGGTTTPLTTVGGVKCFDFNGSGYWESDSNDHLVRMGGNATLLFWMYAQDNTERDTIFEKAGTSTNSYRQEIAVTLETNEGFSYYSRQTDNYDHASTTAMTLNAWNLMGIKITNGYTTAARTGFYSKNGAAWTSNYNSRSDTPLNQAGDVRIGTGYAGPVENGYLASLYVYNRVFDDNDVAQFYEATRNRFGL